MNGSDFNNVYNSSYAFCLVVTNAHRRNLGTFDILFNVVFCNYPNLLCTVYFHVGSIFDVMILE